MSFARELRVSGKPHRVRQLFKESERDKQQAARKLDEM